MAAALREDDLLHDEDASTHVGWWVSNESEMEISAEMPWNYSDEKVVVARIVLPLIALLLCDSWHLKFSPVHLVPSRDKSSIRRNTRSRSRSLHHTPTR